VIRPAAGLVLLAAGLAACGLRRGDLATALRARGLMVPVAGVDPAGVPDTFEEARDGGRRRHLAHDIPAARGTPVVAADAGVVLAVRENHRGGRTVWTCDPDRRFVYYYAHLDRPRPDLRAGTRVARGELIGWVGTTGNADRAGPHLHFQVATYPASGRWWDGEPIDARPFFRDPGRAHDP
jgi:murein DD-endopeptidase MepM/ murein hydrolase activator NlpD